MDIKEALLFLSQLKKNNNKDWFDSKKNEWNLIRSEFIFFIENLIQQISIIDQSIGELKASQCVFRIYNDLRFSKDKSPYKTHLGAIIAKGGRKTEHAGYYLHIEPEKSFLAGGSYMPQAERLAGIRQEIDFCFSDFKNIINNSTFRKYFNKPEGESLSRPPRGYTDSDNPALEYIKMKSWVAYHYISDQDLIKKADTSILNACKALKPLNDFLNRPLD